MSEPWYQTMGPCASQVRQDVFKYITENFYNEDIKEFDHDFTNELTPQRSKIIRKVIFQIIPDTRNDFGSYRGYTTFNVINKISFEVIKEIEIQDKAINIINNKLTPYLKHYLYKPNGIRMKQIAKNTLIGKNNLKN